MVAKGHEVAAVYSQPPRPGDRGRVERSAVHRRAEELGLTVRTPASLRSADEQQAFAALDLGAAVVAAYGLLLPRAILAAPRLGCFNLHASLLPRWRGAAPIQRAILAGDAETGISIMQMEMGLDTGPVLARAPVAVGRMTAGELTEALAHTGAGLMVEVLDAPARHPPEPQDETRVTWAPKIDKAEARIDWRDSAAAIERRVRAMNPAPGAWFETPAGRVKLWAADPAPGGAEPGRLVAPSLVACGDAGLHLRTVQPAGGRRMAAEEWWRGARLAVGDRLG
jgi:methionyl-tRNA formyltransferase